jgi:hypothetical protein
MGAEVQLFLDHFDRGPFSHVGSRRGVIFREANLQGADLFRVDLRGIELRETNLQKANLRQTRLQLANLQGVDPRGVYLQRANLEMANLKAAVLRGADPRRAKLHKTQFQEANLQEADLRWTSWRMALLPDPEGGKLRGTDLRDADLHFREPSGQNPQGQLWRVWSNMPNPSKAPPCPMAKRTRTGSKTKRGVGRTGRMAALRNVRWSEPPRKPNMRTSVGPHSDG